DSEQQKNAAAQQVECKYFAQRMRMSHEAIEADAHQHGARQFSQDRGAHGRGAWLGGPATSMGRVTAMDSTMNASTNRISGLANPTGKARNPPEMAKPGNPVARNTAGPATSASRNQRAPVAGA